MEGFDLGSEGVVYRDQYTPEERLLVDIFGEPRPEDEKQRRREETTRRWFNTIYGSLVQTPIVLDPESYKPQKGILARYGKKMVEEGGKYYKRASVAQR